MRTKTITSRPNWKDLFRVGDDKDLKEQLYEKNEPRGKQSEVKNLDNVRLKPHAYVICILLF